MSRRVSVQKAINVYWVSSNSFGWKAGLFMATERFIKTCSRLANSVVKGACTVLGERLIYSHNVAISLKRILLTVKYQRLLRADLIVSLQLLSPIKSG